MELLKKFDLQPRSSFSPLQAIGKTRQLLLPAVLASPNLVCDVKEAAGAAADHEEIQKSFPTTYGQPRIVLQSGPASAASSTPLRVGVVLSGGQAPGGHNVIAGVYDFCKKVSAQSQIIGFMDGPQGVYNGEYCLISDAMMDAYRNSGGFDMIGSGRHKIEKPEQFKASMDVCTALDLDGVVIIGGDDSNTNAALLAEYFKANKCKTKVCGAPKTIDGDMKVHPYIPISFGFDTACRTYSELIGNLGQDTLSSQKYYHFVRLMGRAASNIALECALLTRPNVCLISEEVQEKKLTLGQITQQVVDVVVQRAEQGKDYGIVLLPEGLIEFINEFSLLIAEINDVLAGGADTTEEAVLGLLSAANQAVFSYLPQNIKQQLLLDRDPHGNVQVAKIETEKLLAQTVLVELDKLKSEGKYKGTFSPQFHSYGYEGRSCLPSDFDSTYCYALGQTVGAMLSLGCTGLISSVTNLSAPVHEWCCGGVPITMMCHTEKRHGHVKPVIKKALVELDGEPFKCFASQRADWAAYDLYRSPGPIQFFGGGGSVELSLTLSLELNQADPRMDAADLSAAKKVQDAAGKIKFGKFLQQPLTGSSNRILSETQQERALYKPQLCPAMSNLKQAYALCEASQHTQCMKTWDLPTFETEFPSTYGAPLVSFDQSPDLASTYRPAKMQRRESLDAKAIVIGVVFCGRQSPGGHDIIAGLLDALPPGSKLLGFVGGNKGLLEGHAVEISPAMMANYRGQGGFELLGRTVERIEHTVEVFEQITATCKKFSLQGLVLLGGPRTNTDAAYLAEYLQSQGTKTSIVTVPLTMNGGIRNAFVETTVGFDTTSKVTAQIVGNNSTDGASAKKYYYFQRLMGQEPSHLTMEVALNTKPNYTLLAEEVSANNTKLADIVSSIADMVEARANLGKNYGSVVIPEGLIESIPELRLLISEIDAAFESKVDLTLADLREDLTLWSKALLDSLPAYIQAQLMLSRTTDRRMLLSQAETERLLAHFVDIELELRKKKGTYKGSFSVVCSFIGYQARGAMPTNFDTTYAYNLGHIAAVLVEHGGCSGYMATVNNLKADVSQWQAGGVPITAMMFSDPTSSIESERGLCVPTAHIDLSSPSYKAFLEMKKKCATMDMYENPGPVQFKGPTADCKPTTLSLETFDYMGHIQDLYRALERITSVCRPGCSAVMLQVATRSLHALTDTIDMIQQNGV